MPQNVDSVPEGWSVRVLETDAVNSPRPGSPMRFSPAGPEGENGTEQRNLWFPYTEEYIHYPAAECAPSGLELADPDGAGVTAGETVRIGSPIVLKGSPELSELGEAVHGYMAVDTSQMDTLSRKAVAERILCSRGMEKHLASDELVRQGDALREYIEKTWAGAVWNRELSLSVTLSRAWPAPVEGKGGGNDDRFINGYADLVLDTPAGLIIIDHKSMKGKESYLQEKALRFSPQLAAYSEAASRAYEKPVLKTFIHYSLEGILVEVLMGDRAAMLREAVGTD